MNIEDVKLVLGSLVIIFDRVNRTGGSKMACDLIESLGTTLCLNKGQLMYIERSHLLLVAHVIGLAD